MARSKEAWDAWFDAQYDLGQKLDELFAEATRGKSPEFKAATASAMVEHFAELMRLHVELPAEAPLPPTQGGE
jgi:hypothetical protein